MSPTRPSQKLLHSISGGETARQEMAEGIQSQISQSDIGGTDLYASSSPSPGKAHAVPVEDPAAQRVESSLSQEAGAVSSENNNTSTSSDGSSDSRAVICAADEDDNDDANDDDDDDSEYDYDYEDDEDGHFQGFLAPCESEAAVNREAATTAAHESTNPNLIENTDGNPGSVENSNSAINVEADNVDGNEAAKDAEEDSDDDANQKTKSGWEEPSRAAVSMSLRAEREKSGGKRRLASDLYKVMRGNTTEQGFTMEPQSEDSMDKWIIKLFGFDKDSNLQKDLDLLNLTNIELEMSFPDDYPFAPPFVRVLRPRFKRQTGFVMNGALCMELLTSDGWNPVNDIDSVIVSIRSLLVVGDGRLAAAAQLEEARGEDRKKASAKSGGAKKADEEPKANEAGAGVAAAAAAAAAVGANDDNGGWGDMEDIAPDRPKKRNSGKISKEDIGSYSEAEALSAYSHLSDYHKRRGWDSSGWWARKG